ncbi:unnamed protein product [Urochloa humidicola]
MAEAEERPSGGGDGKTVTYPTGFRFKPTLRELVEFYLLPKQLDKPTVPNVAVIEADAYECDPEILTKRYEARGADENWYFLSPRSRRYPGGDRPTRRTADNRGRWKPSTGQSKPGKDAAAGHSKAKKGPKKNLSVGTVEFTENTLAYYLGEPRNETKTKWLMHELTIPDPEPQKEKDLGSPIAAEKPRDHMLLNKYVMCRIYKSPLRKWKELENEEGSTSYALTCDEDVPTSSQSMPVLESSGETSVPPPPPLLIKRAGKRPATEQPSGHANVPNKRASSQKTMLPPGPPVPTPHANGGGGMRALPGGAAGYYQGGMPGLPQLVQWPPATYSSMQGPVQLQQPPLVYGPAPMQRLPALKMFPPHRAAAVTVPDSLGQTLRMPMRPPNLAAGQPVRPPFFIPQPPQMQQQEEDEEMEMQRVYAQLIAELKLQKAQQERALCAGQQQIMPVASTRPTCFDKDASHPAGTEFMAPCTRFPEPHNLYPCGGGVQELQQASPAIPEASVPPGAAAPVEAAAAADSKLPVPGDAKEGSE